MQIESALKDPNWALSFDAPYDHIQSNWIIHFLLPLWGVLHKLNTKECFSLYNFVKFRYNCLFVFEPIEYEGQTDIKHR